MNKSKLSKAKQKKVSKICQECGACCKGGPMTWFCSYAKIEDIRRWSKSRDTWAVIRWFLRDSRDKGLSNDKHITMRNIAYHLGFKSNFKSPDMSCGCLETTGTGKKKSFCCGIERKLGWEYKPETCRDHVCEKLKGLVKP